MTDRNYGHVVHLNGASTLSVVGNIQQQHSLASGQTYVCQFDVWDTTTVRRGDTITIYHVNNDTGQQVPQFKGRINKTTASRFPHRVTVYCQGFLSRLRRARLASDYTISGMTDGEFVRFLLTYCDIPFDPDDIQDAGYTLPGIETLYWKKGQRASDILSQLDEMMGMATIEVHDGRVIRFAYSLVPYDYSTPDQVYRASSTGEPMYEDSRERGDLDAVRNVVQVTGASWQCGDNDECSCAPFANGDTDSAALASGVRTEPLTYSSEFIQDGATALAVAKRLLRENNREPDVFTLTTYNDNNILPGRPIDVQDAVYGIDLGGDRRYIATDIARDGDFMTATLKGGSAGPFGTPDSGIEQQCNQDSSTGDGGGSFDPPPVDIPPVTGPVDVPPETDETGPFIDCTAYGYFTCDEDDPPDTCYEAGVSPSCAGTPPADVCDVAGWHPDNYPVAGETYDCTCEVATNIVRTTTGNDHHFYVNGDGGVERITVCQDEGDSIETGVGFYIGNAVAYNATDIGETYTNAIAFGLAGCVEFNFKFCKPGETITINFQGMDGGGSPAGDHTFTLYAEPGGTNYDYTGINPRQINSTVTGAELSGDAPPHHAYGLAIRNSGGIDLGGGLPLDTELHGMFCVEVDGDNPRLFWDNGVNAGYHQYLTYINEETPLPGEPFNVQEDSDHTYHVLRFGLGPGEDGSCQEDCPGPQLWGMITGSETCAANPDYVPPDGG